MCRVPCALPSAVCSALEIMPRTLPNGTWPWRPNTTKNILAEMVDHNRSANSQKVITRIVIQVPKHLYNHTHNNTTASCLPSIPRQHACSVSGNPAGSGSEGLQSQSAAWIFGPAVFNASDMSRKHIGNISIYRYTM